MDNMSMVATAPFSIKLVYITQTPMLCQLTWKQLLGNQALILNLSCTSCSTRDETRSLPLGATNIYIYKNK
jgi:hypothetical protein